MNSLMTKPGVDFLKCAFAPPDFSVDPGRGIPDGYEGKTICQKDVYTGTKSFAAGKSTWLLVLPTPGKAFWTLEKGIGEFPISTDEFKNVDYPTAKDMFSTASNTNDDNVTHFRYASTAFGIYPTSNLTQFGGSITVWKAAMSVSSAKVDVSVNTVVPKTISLTTPVLTGTHNVRAVPRDNYCNGFQHGCFTTAMASDTDFPFYPITESFEGLPISGYTAAETGMAFRIGLASTDNAALVGCGGMDAIIIRVDTPTGCTNNAVIKAWSCLEYKVNATSSLAQLATPSPPLDLVALEEYRRVALQLPVAVKAADNGWMWDRIRALLSGSVAVVRGAASVASYAPGPIGVAASHVVGLTDMLAHLGL